ncbi:hypothetical protein B0H14DRAFT_2573215 [Mycena olivaceomarginata]|nr:hypothetical protein B0H14DRAFT_2573215 [Mycena olivaceomarginata]
MAKANITDGTQTGHLQFGASTELTSMEYAQSFTDVKLNCPAVVPSQTPVYVNDFTDIVGNIQWFMAQSETAGYSKQGIFNASETQKRSIKLCHVLFQEPHSSNSIPGHPESHPKNRTNGPGKPVQETTPHLKPRIAMLILELSDWDANCVDEQTPWDIAAFITQKCGLVSEGFEGRKAS